MNLNNNPKNENQKGLRRVFKVVKPNEAEYWQEKVDFAQNQLNELSKLPVSEKAQADSVKWEKEMAWANEKLRAIKNGTVKQSVSIVRNSITPVSAEKQAPGKVLEATVVDMRQEPAIMYGKFKQKQSGSMGNGKPNPGICADMLSNCADFRFYNGKMYFPVRVSVLTQFCVYKQMSEKELMTMLNTFFHQEALAYADANFLKKIKKFLEVTGGRDVADLSDVLRDRVYFRNGFYSFSSRCFSSENDGIFFPSYLDMDYIPGPAACPWFDTLLHQISGGNVQLKAYALELMALAITNEFPKLVVLCQGPGNTGKSLYLNIIQALYPSESCSNLTFEQLSTRFAMAPLVSKIVNIGDECTAEVKEAAVNTIKLLSSGVMNTRVSVEGKGKDIISAVMRVHLYFATNNFIHLRGATDAFTNRIMVLPFKNKIHISTNGYDLTTLLRAERQGIVQELLRAYHGYLERGRQFSAWFPLNGVVDTVDNIETVQISREQSVAEWASSVLIASVGDSIRTDFLKRRYNEYCQSAGLFNHMVPYTSEFSKIIRRLGYPVEKAHVVHRGDESRSAVIGYKLREKGGE